MTRTTTMAIRMETRMIEDKSYKVATEVTAFGVSHSPETYTIHTNIMCMYVLIFSV